MSGRGVTADVAILEIAQGSFEYRDGGRQWPSERGAGTPDHGLPLSRRRKARDRTAERVIMPGCAEPRLLRC